MASIFGPVATTWGFECGGWKTAKKCQEREQMMSCVSLCPRITDGSQQGLWTMFGTVLVGRKDSKRHVTAQADEGQLQESKINGVDFSPDSSRLISASNNRTASIWDIATRERVQTLYHGDKLVTTAHKAIGSRQPLLILFESGTVTMAPCSYTSQQL